MLGPHHTGGTDNGSFNLNSKKREDMSDNEFVERDLQSNKQENQSMIHANPITFQNSRNSKGTGLSSFDQQNKKDRAVPDMQIKEDDPFLDRIKNLTMGQQIKSASPMKQFQESKYKMSNSPVVHSDRVFETEHEHGNQIDNKLDDLKELDRIEQRK